MKILATCKRISQKLSTEVITFELTDDGHSKFDARGQLSITRYNGQKDAVEFVPGRRYVMIMQGEEQE